MENELNPKVWIMKNGVYMKKKIISLALVICMLMNFCSTVYASEFNTYELENEISEQIEQVIYMTFSDEPGLYELENPVAIYNADMECVYYIAPVFCDEECVGTMEIDVSGNVSITEDINLYNNINQLAFSEYILYTLQGKVYVETPETVIEMYDSGFCISSTNNFMLLSYAHKASTVDIYLEEAQSMLNVYAVIEATEPVCVISSEISLFALVPSVEYNNCSITDYEEQGNYNICWAACVATIVNYKNGRNLTAEDVASTLGHNYKSSSYAGASASATVSALAYYGLSYNRTSSKLSWASVKSNVTSNRPFIIGITCSAGGHMMTGYGYSCQYGDDEAYANSRYVQVWDPNGCKRTLQYYASSYSLYGYSWNWTETLVD